MKHARGVFFVQGLCGLALLLYTGIAEALPTYLIRIENPRNNVLFIHNKALSENYDIPSGHFRDFSGTRVSENWQLIYQTGISGRFTNNLDAPLANFLAFDCKRFADINLTETTIKACVYELIQGEESLLGVDYKLKVKQGDIVEPHLIEDCPEDNYFSTLVEQVRVSPPFQRGRYSIYRAAGCLRDSLHAKTSYSVLTSR